MHASKVLVLAASLFSFGAVSAPAALPDVELEARATGPKATDAKFIQAILDTHNTHRKAHHSQNLVWSTKMAQYATKWANKCVFQHTGGPYGENLYAIYPGYSNYVTGTQDGVMAWINEVKNYNFSNPGFSAATGHFTQAVWNATTAVGCSWNTVNCQGAAYLFCEYYKPGNVEGYFAQNVFPTSYKPKKKTS